ncbi:hypothetical protein DB30_04147 [Enhygromyxa salina]|uniref:Uncharacterized protein n=2 Tax=Enhygromyxa salina TaxID=215803 RepID=A0A0C2A0A9_9BACT|nr:hypothetical protein DB30_04147 [Enhygromyxa salina]
MATAAVSSLEVTVFTSSSTRDGLGPLLAAISPDGSEVGYGSSERAALKTGLARPLEDIEQFVRPETSENASHASGHE